MNDKCCICPHFSDKTHECEADQENETCLIDAIEMFIEGIESEIDENERNG